MRAVLLDDRSNIRALLVTSMAPNGILRVALILAYLLCNTGDASEST